MFIICGKPPENLEADLIITRLEDKSEITIDQIHELQKQLAFKTTNFKVAILEAQCLNVSAQNALLKTLEEPPEGVIITLYVDSVDNLLPTIVSRCKIINKPISQLPITNDQLKIIQLIQNNDIKNGFKWAEEIKDRQKAIKIIDDLLSIKESLPIFRKLQQTKKFLHANCNLRLTLENLFI